ncbi:MAG: FtsW/RodA/SpoVE family cell cycle protein [Spirochaetales bacterium]|nr:FtsW/RodA/SpoVE family cell cycle protein [Spirochaetales bacterium]
MSTAFRPEKMERTSFDFIFFIVLFLIAGLGLCALFAASYFSSERIFSDYSIIIRKQILFALISLILCFFIYKMPFELFEKFAMYLLIFSFVLSILVLIPGIGDLRKGGKRWLTFPFLDLTFQPSELVKLSIILYLSRLISKKGEKNRDFKKGFLPNVIILSLFALLVLAQNDLSSCILIYFTGCVLLFAGGARLSHLIGLQIFYLAIISFVVAVIMPEKIFRIQAFLNPEAFEFSYGYQARRSIEAISSGGFFGKGFGAGTLKHSVPELHSDYIFASVAEDVGFFGVFFIIILFCLFLFKGFQTAYYVKDDPFKFLVAIGIASLLGFQFFLNLAVVSRLVPTTGVPLPFFSAGGTSLIMTFLMAGLLVNISKDANRIRNERRSF